METKEEFLKNHLKVLLQDLQNDLNWEWDDRFDALLTRFSIAKQESIQSALKKYFSSEWNNKTIKKAPAYIKRKTGSFSDLRIGQLLFTLDSEDHIIIAVWWPWGDKENVSLRIASTEINESEKLNILGQLRRFFSK